jgi:excisionase family DNA binding protein
MSSDAVKDPLADRFYRPRLIAERTGRHYVTVLKAIADGELKAQRVGRRALGVRASEVERWLASFNPEAA